jgi:hypothetical protein
MYCDLVPQIFGDLRYDSLLRLHTRAFLEAQIVCGP